MNAHSRSLLEFLGLTLYLGAPVLLLALFLQILYLRRSQPQGISGAMMFFSCLVSVLLVTPLSMIIWFWLGILLPGLPENLFMLLNVVHAPTLVASVAVVPFVTLWQARLLRKLGSSA